jgi:hypothetical protein
MIQGAFLQAVQRVAAETEADIAVVGHEHSENQESWQAEGMSGENGGT